VTVLWRLAAWLATTILVAALASACKRSEAAATSGEPVPVVVTAESDGLLLTWIDDKGNFQVETAASAVPLMGRDAVRVVDPNKDDGTHADRIFVADMRATRPDGTYPVRTMTRADFEAIAVARRQQSGPTLASAAPPPASAVPDLADTGSAKTTARGPIIIYGAEWCGACHEAAAYLRRKGIPYVEKDVEKDPGAAREMQTKLASNGLRTGSIPVIDVRGKVMVGFNAQEIDGALGQAL
jgi:glutaredoxin